MPKRVRKYGGVYNDSIVHQSVASRHQGLFEVPDDQRRLNQAMEGKDFYCPNCGVKWKVPSDQRIMCNCGALWTMSWGWCRNGNAFVVRVERHR